MEGLRILAVCLADVVIGVLLFVLACILGSTLHNALTPGVRFLYLFWFMIALLPFVQYVKWRQVMNFDGWDVLVYGTTFFFAMILGETLPLVLSAVEPMLKISVILFVASRWEQFREMNLPRPEQPSAKSTRCSNSIL